RRFTWQEFESGTLQTCPEPLGVQSQRLPPVIRLFGDLDGFDRARRNGGGKTVGKKIRPCSLAQQIDDRLRCGYEAAHRPAQALAECAGDDIHPSLDTRQSRRSPSGFAQMACRVAIIDHDESIVALGKL